jgi:hypothetical protein
MGISRLCVALLVFTALGYANTIFLTGLDTPLGEQQTLWINENGTNTQLYWVGGINAKIDGHIRVVWCVQLLVDINLNTTYNTTVDFADTPNLKRVGWMIQNQLPGVATQTQGAAFQLAIWDIIEDNGDGLSLGKVAKSTDPVHPTDSGVMTAAQTYEAQSVGKSYAWVPIYHNVTVNGGTPVQNLVGPIVNDGGPLSEAPEPKDLAMVLSGLFLMAARRLRKRSK